MKFHVAGARRARGACGGHSQYLSFGALLPPNVEGQATQPHKEQPRRS